MGLPARGRNCFDRHKWVMFIISNSVIILKDNLMQLMLLYFIVRTAEL